MRSADSHANSNFMRSLSHGICDHAVQSENSKDQTDSAYGGKHLSAESDFEECDFVEVSLHCTKAEDAHIRSDIPSDGSDARSESFRIAVRFNQERSARFAALVITPI